MAYLGNRPATGENNAFRILDDISSHVVSFNGSSASVVSVSADTITIAGSEHRYITGQKVTYSKGGGTVITGLTDATAYYVIKDSDTTIQLATTASNATNGVAVNLTGLGAGTAHTLTLAFDGTNTKFKPTYNDGSQNPIITRAAQLVLSLNGVIQQPVDSASPSSGFGIDVSGNIIFSTAPDANDDFWGHVHASNTVTFDISDNDIDNFTGNGSTTDFTLSKTPPNNENILVTLDGVVQYPSDNSNTRAYTLSENELQMVSAPASGVAIQVRHIGFAGPTSGGSGGVTGFYGRTGNVVLKSTDNPVVGNLTAVDGTFSGNVSIAKTLTYMDVAHIDAVGIITAQSGIQCLDDLNVGLGTFFVDKSTGQVSIGSASMWRSDTVAQVYGKSPDLSLSRFNDQFMIAGNETSGAINTGAGIQFFGHDGVQERGWAYIRGLKENGTSGNRASYLSFATRPNGGTLEERLRITSAGNVGINTISPQDLLHIGGTSTDLRFTANQIKFDRDSAASYIDQYGTGSIVFRTTPSGSQLERLTITSAGQALVGTTSNRAINSHAPRLQVSGTDYSTSTVSLVNNAADATGAYLFFTKQRSGSAGGSTAVAQDDIIGDIRFTAGDGTDVETGAARITVVAESNAGSNSVPSHMRFSTTSTTTPVERLRIDSSGKVGIATDNPTTTLHVKGSSQVTTGIGNTIFKVTSTTFRVDQCKATSGWSNMSHATSPLIKTGWLSGLGDHLYLSSGGNTAESGQMVLLVSDGHGVKVGKSAWDGSNNTDLAAGTEYFRIKTDGKVGIGLTNPGAVVHAYHATSNTIAQFESGDAGAVVVLKDNATYSYVEQNGNDFIIHADPGATRAASALSFKIDGNERLRISNAGLVSINSTSYEALKITTTENGNNGPEVQLIHNSASPAANDCIGQLRFSGKDSAGNTDLMSRIETIIDDPTSGQESAHLNFATRGYAAFNTILRLKARGTASAPSYTADDMNGIILDTYNTGNPYPRYFNFIAKSAGNTDSNIGFWTESVGGSPTEKMRVRDTGQVEFKNGSFSDNVNCVMASGSTLEIGATATIKLRTATNERLQIDSTGNVHVGFSGNSLYFQNGFNNSNARIQNAGATNNSNLRFLTRNAGTETERFRIASDGSIYVGGSGASATAGKLWFNDTSAYSSYIKQIAGSSALSFHTGQSQPERLRITSAGYVGINTTAPTRPLHIVGNDGSSGATSGNSDTTMCLDNAGTNGSMIEFLNANNGAGHIMFTDTDGSNVGRISYHHNGDYFRLDAGGLAERVLCHGSGETVFKSNNASHISLDRNADNAYIRFRSNSVSDAATIQCSESSGGAFLTLKTKNVDGNLRTRYDITNNGNTYTGDYAGTNRTYPIIGGASIGTGGAEAGQVNWHDIQSPLGTVGGWVLLGLDYNGAHPWPAKGYKIAKHENGVNCTRVYQIWHDGDANYDYGGLWEVRLNEWGSSSGHFESATFRCINGKRDDMKLLCYNDDNGVWIMPNTIWGQIFIRRSGWDGSGRTRGSSYCAVANNGALAVGDSSGVSGTIPSGSGKFELYPFDGAGGSHTGGRDMENENNFAG